MTGISSDISSIPRDLAHVLNPIISELRIDSIGQLIEDIGAIASQVSGTGVVSRNPRNFSDYFISNT
jgi:hypothetical protein